MVKLRKRGRNQVAHGFFIEKSFPWFSSLARSGLSLVQSMFYKEVCPPWLHELASGSRQTIVFKWGGFS